MGKIYFQANAASVKSVAEILAQNQMSSNLKMQIPGRF